MGSCWQSPHRKERFMSSWPSYPSWVTALALGSPTSLRCWRSRFSTRWKRWGCTPFQHSNPVAGYNPESERYWYSTSNYSVKLFFFFFFLSGESSGHRSGSWAYFYCTRTLPCGCWNEQQSLVLCLKWTRTGCVMLLELYHVIYQCKYLLKYLIEM